MILITIDNFERILLCVIAILLLNGKRMPNIHKLIEMIKNARPPKASASTTEGTAETMPKELSEIIEEEKTENKSNSPEETV